MKSRCLGLPVPDIVYTSARSERFYLFRPTPPPIFPIGGCLGSERLSFRSPTGTSVVHPTRWVHRDSCSWTPIIYSTTRSFPICIYSEKFLLYGTPHLNPNYNDNACS